MDELVGNPPLIWWLSHDECESIVKTRGFARTWPEYLRTQFSYRRGRPGGGRLWADKQFGAVRVEWGETKPLAGQAEERGGIVMRAEDAPLVSGLPGFITDLALNLHEPEAEP